MQRNNTVDYMRILGILLIILAHVTPPSFLFQLRTFDVPMMTFISGMAFYCAGKYKVKFIPYAISRFKRLVFPVWAFQVIFFLLIFIIKPESLYKLFTFKTIISSMALSGFGYFWVIKVFLLISILSPIFFTISERLSGYQIPLVIILSLLTATFVSTIHIPSHSIYDKLISRLVSDLIIPAISYGSMFLLGVKWLRISNKDKNIIFTIFLITTIVFIVYEKISTGRIPHPQDYKYPPTFFFISYSIPMTYVSFKIFETIQKKYGSLPKTLRFISSNTIWIYLWHIPVVTYFYMTNTNMNYIEKYVIALSFGTFMTAIQYRIVNKLISLLKEKEGLSKFIRHTFTG